jgi:hypothetical protein
MAGNCRSDPGLPRLRLRTPLHPSPGPLLLLLLLLLHGLVHLLLREVQLLVGRCRRRTAVLPSLLGEGRRLRLRLRLRPPLRVLLLLVGGVPGMARARVECLASVHAGMGMVLALVLAPRASSSRPSPPTHPLLNGLMHRGRHIGRPHA